MTDAQKALAFHDWRLDEISPVDMPAQIPAVETIIKRHGGEPDPWAEEFTKRIQLTTIADAHQHTIDDTYGEDGGHTSYDRGKDDDQDHSHGWVRGMDGSLTIAMSDGHTHEVLDTESETVAVNARFELRQFTRKERDKLASDGKALPDGSYPIVTKGDLRNAISAFGRGKAPGSAAKHIKARARSLEATEMLPDEGMLAIKKAAGDAGDEGNKKKEGSMASPEDKAADTEAKEKAAAKKKFDEMKKNLEDQTAIAGMTDVEKAFMTSLDEVAKTAFIAAKPEARKVDIEKATADDPVVYTGLDGVEYKKSDGRLTDMAKRLDAEVRKAEQEREKTRNLELQKRAGTELKFLPGEEVEKVELLKAIDEIEDEETRGKVTKMVQAQNTQMADAFKKRGTTVAPDAAAEGSSDDKLEKLAVEKAKADGISIEKARDAVLDTPEGEAIYAAYLEDNPAQTHVGATR